jgi:glutathione-regulated potassium-efflux system protein KefB
MSADPFLSSAVIFLGAAVVAVPLFKRLGLGSVLGYLAAGAVIGPWGLRWVSEVEHIRRFSEFGVVLLLFVIGLELLPARLWEMRRAVFGLGLAQVAATAVVVMTPVALFGAGVPASVVAGFGLALSSTAVALQLLTERNQLATSQGRDAFAVLLFQDLAVLPALALLPLLGSGAYSETARPWWTHVLALLALAATVAGGRLLLRPFFRVLAGIDSHEAFTAGALLVVVSVALFMNALGLSMALGAFIAGMLLADSEYRHALEADIEPFKGLLLGLFFMAVGMGVNFGVLAERPVLIAAATVALVAVKAVIMYALARRAGHAAPAARQVAIGLSQGGEFAFVLFVVAAGSGIMDPGMGDVLTLVVALSMVTTPLLFLAEDRFVSRFAPKARVPAEPELPPEENQVIIAGFGRFGQIVARVLAVRGIPFTALDKDPSQIEFVARFGNKIYFGDVSRLDLLRAAKADKASLLVLAIDDVEASLRMVEIVQTHFPNLTILARARNRVHAYRLLEMGVENVCRETFLSSLQMARHALTELGLPDSVAEETVRVFRDHDERLMRRAARHHDDLEKLIEIAKEGRAELSRLFEQDRR